METSLQDYDNNLVQWRGCNNKNQKNDSPVALGL